MPILYNKFEVDPPQTVFSSVEEAQNQPYLKKIKLRMDGTGTTRCLGSGLDACRYDYRTSLGRTAAKHGVSKYDGEEDEVIDAWNMLDNLRESDDIMVLYDRERDGELDQELLNTLPVNTFIGTGDAREGKYISWNNPRRSRHAIVTIGNLEDGTPLIYDLGKVKKGVPDKYRNQVNYIAMPKSQYEKYLQGIDYTSNRSKPTEYIKKETITRTPIKQGVGSMLNRNDNTPAFLELLKLIK